MAFSSVSTITKIATRFGSKSQKQTKENEENKHLIQKIMRNPANKKCADCFAPNPNFINFALRTFLCEACAKIHVELQESSRTPQKTISIKHIPNGNFTNNEVSRMLQSKAGNEAVNSIYLSCYHHSTSFPTQPDQFSNHDMREYWICKKYIERAWHDEESNRNIPHRPRKVNLRHTNTPVMTENPLMKNKRKNYNKSIPIVQKPIDPQPILQHRDRRRTIDNSFGRPQDAPTNTQVSILRQRRRTYDNRSNPNTIPKTLSEMISLSANQRCADCTSKLPSFVNLSLKSFVCSACAIIQEELLAHEVVRIGEYVFQPVDIERMSEKPSGNKSLNNVYLARYNPVKEVDTPPNGGSSAIYRASWMMKKYMLKTWCKTAVVESMKQERSRSSSILNNPHTGRNNQKKIAPVQPNPTFNNITPSYHRTQDGDNGVGVDDLENKNTLVNQGGLVHYHRGKQQLSSSYHIPEAGKKYTYNAQMAVHDNEDPNTSRSSQTQVKTQNLGYNTVLPKRNDNPAMTINHIHDSQSHDESKVNGENSQPQLQNLDTVDTKSVSTMNPEKIPWRRRTVTFVMPTVDGMEYRPKHSSSFQKERNIQPRLTAQELVHPISPEEVKVLQHIQRPHQNNIQNSTQDINDDQMKLMLTDQISENPQRFQQLSLEPSSSSESIEYRNSKMISAQYD